MNWKQAGRKPWPAERPRAHLHGPPHALVLQELGHGLQAEHDGRDHDARHVHDGVRCGAARRARVVHDAPQARPQSARGGHAQERQSGAARASVRWGPPAC
eukprot:scaffold1134_cov295-Prasinococcus_capsulatus_cf.AAC.7